MLTNAAYFFTRRRNTIMPRAPKHMSAYVEGSGMGRSVLNSVPVRPKTATLSHVSVEAARSIFTLLTLSGLIHFQVFDETVLYIPVPLLESKKRIAKTCWLGGSVLVIDI